MDKSQPLYGLDKDKVDEIYKAGAFLIVENMPQVFYNFLLKYNICHRFFIISL